MRREIKWWQPQVGKSEEANLLKVLQSQFINEGPQTDVFEKKIAQLINVKHAVAVTSGTSAIFLGLKACGVGAGDEVIVPDITFAATANAVHLTGATPVLVDIDAETLCLSPTAFRKAISPKTKAVLPVHVTGRSADMKEIVKIAREHKLFVIEDAAEALLSKSDLGFLGTIGDFGAFSFSPNKTITTGQGGLLVFNDQKYYLEVRRLKDQGRPHRGTGGDDIHESIGFNFKFTDLQAAVGLGQLEVLEERVLRLKRTDDIYRNELSSVRDLKFFKVTEGIRPQWTDVLAERRDELTDYLQSNGIQTRKFWLPLHTHPSYELPPKNFPNSATLGPKALWLPSNFLLNDDDIKYVTSVVKEFYRG